MSLVGTHFLRFMDAHVVCREVELLLKLSDRLKPGFKLNKIL